MRICHALAVSLLLPACSGDGTNGEPASEADTDTVADNDGELSLLTQDIDGDVADAGRDVAWLDGLIYAVGYGIHEGEGNKDDLSWSAYARAYDEATGEARAERTHAGTLEAGEKTWLLSGIVAEDDGTSYLYASGKSNAEGDLCVLDGTTPDGSMDGYLFQYSLPDLEVVDCLAMSTGQYDEITGMDAGDGSIWLGGATTGQMGEERFGNNDVVVAALRANLDSPPRVAQIGTDAFDEVLGLDYDEDADMLYISGSTQGPLCKDWQRADLDLGCTGGADGAFDGYVAGFHWDTDTFELELRFVYQFGVAGEDTAQDVAAWTDVEDLAGGGAGTRYLYATGRTPTSEPDRKDQDLYLTRIRLEADPEGRGMVPAVVDGLAETVRTQLGTLGGDVGQNLLVTGDAVWIAASVDGATDHAGVCGGTLEPEDDDGGDGDDSHPIGVVWGFSHEDPTQVSAAWERAGDGDAGHRAVNMNGLVDGGGTIWAVGATSAHFVAESEAFCGSDADNEADDEIDAALFHFDP